MTPGPRDNFQILADNFFWLVVGSWNNSNLEVQKDYQSKWHKDEDENGILVIYNECASPNDVFKKFTDEFFLRFNMKDFIKNWVKVTRLSPHDEWSEMKWMPLNRGANFMQVGWKMKIPVLMAETDVGEEEESETPPPFSRKIMD